jgi:hypothetical protein
MTSENVKEVEKLRMKVLWNYVNHLPALILASTFLGMPLSGIELLAVSNSVAQFDIMQYPTNTPVHSLAYCCFLSSYS